MCADPVRAGDTGYRLGIEKSQGQHRPGQIQGEVLTVKSRNNVDTRYHKSGEGFWKNVKYM